MRLPLALGEGSSIRSFSIPTTLLKLLRLYIGFSNDEARAAYILCRIVIKT
jgi:hypothetical protein